MAVINVSKDLDLPRYKYFFQLESQQEAKRFEISLLMSVREKWRPLDLYSKGAILILDGPVVDENGNIENNKVQLIDSIANAIQTTINNDVSGFKTRIQQIIQFNQHLGLELAMADVMDITLSRNTKLRFMEQEDFELFARIILRSFDHQYWDNNNLDERMKAVFADQNFIASMIKEIEDSRR